MWGKYMTKRNQWMMGSLALILASLVGTGSFAAEANARKQSKTKSFFSAAISGRIMLDYTDARAENAGFDLNDLEVRRAYLGIAGKFGQQISYAVTGSVGDDGEIGLVGATLDWKPQGSRFKVRMGQFKTPMFLDESTSSKYISTFERAAFTDAVEINRRLGLAVFHTGDKHTFAAGFFGGNLEQDPFDSGTAIAARATWTPIKTKEQTLHLGASFRVRNQSASQSNLRYRQRPFAHVSDRIISTGRLGDSDLVIGGELAMIHKNMWAAAELSLIEADCPSCASDPGFSGYYLEAGFFVGGKKRYAKGSFARPKVQNPFREGGYGALAFVLRYDGLDLNDTSVTGGTLDTIIAGADWYPNDHIRIGINYFHADAVLGNHGSGLGREFNQLRRSGAAGEVVQGITVRLQYDF
jgi:phosphate-selective porin OprO/OprP